MKIDIDKVNGFMTSFSLLGMAEGLTIEEGELAFRALGQELKRMREGGHKAALSSLKAQLEFAKVSRIDLEALAKEIEGEQ